MHEIIIHTVDIVLILVSIVIVFLLLEKTLKKRDEKAYNKFIEVVKNEPKPIRTPNQSDDDWEREQLIDDLVKKRLELEHLKRQARIKIIFTTLQIIMTTIIVVIFVLNTLYLKGYLQI